MKNQLRVISCDKCRGGMNPLFRVTFSDGFEMQSNSQCEWTDSIYYKLMNEALDLCEYQSPIGASSHEDLYNY
jgi:hypothetical protein